MPKAKRTPEGLIRRKEQSRRAKAKAKLNREYLERAAIAARERYHANKEKYRQIALDYVNRNKEVINERRKRWRRENPDLARERYKRDRANTIKTTIAKFRRGNVSLDEFIGRISKVYVQAFADDEKRGPE